MRSWNLTTKIIASTVAIAGLASFASLSRGVEPSATVAAGDSQGNDNRVSKAAARPQGSFVGTSSCTAVSCHGNASGSKHSQTGLTHSEHTLWLQSDKHADAYNVLFNDVSVAMAKSLKLKTPAHEATLCLNCHSPLSDAPYPATVTDSHRKFVTDGVSCEACHGGASTWLEPHVKADWRSKTPEQKAALGFRDTKDLWTRAKLCADCHVGGVGRDVNHDLYAAGHPRLSFEMSAFHALMPAHWDRNLDKARANHGDVKDRNTVSNNEHSSLEAKLWAIGQVASADSAIDLLLARASANVPTELPTEYPSHETVGAWPELAETACFACHHDLSAPSWRQAKVRYGSRRPGGTPWGTWLFPTISHSAQLAGVDMKAGEGPIGQLTLEMAKPVPDRKLVEEHGRAAKVRLRGIGQSLSHKSFSAQELLAALRTMATDGTELSKQSWDEATQVYLALVALERSHREVSNSSATTSPSQLNELRAILEFEPGLDSPKKFGTKKPGNNGGTSRSHDDLDRVLNQIKTAFEQKP